MSNPARSSTTRSGAFGYRDPNVIEFELGVAAKGAFAANKSNAIETPTRLLRTFKNSLFIDTVSRTIRHIDRHSMI